jgi:hypothetical protein
LKIRHKPDCLLPTPRQAIRLAIEAGSNWPIGLRPLTGRLHRHHHHFEADHLICETEYYDFVSQAALQEGYGNSPA